MTVRLIIMNTFLLRINEDYVGNILKYRHSYNIYYIKEYSINIIKGTFIIFIEYSSNTSWTHEVNLL